MNIYQFNSLYAPAENKEIIRKALTSATNQGEALIPEHLEDVITNTAVRLVPELAIPVLTYDPQKFHEFNRLTSIPGAGSAMGENSTTPTKRGAYQRASVELKIMKRKGAVTGFLKDTSSGYIDASAAEMESHVQSFGNDLRTYMLYGNKGADQYTFDGLDKFIKTNRINIDLVDGVQVNLGLLDDAIDANTRRQGSAHRKVILMSPELLSALSRLWTNVRDNRQASGTTAIEINGGIRLEKYRNIPILETTGTRPVVTMGVVATGTATSGGTITADEYFFRVAPVTWDGEQMSSTEVSQVTTGATSTITLSFTAVENALFYKIYASDQTGTETLVKIVSAFSYDSDGTPSNTPVSSIVFTTSPLTPDTDSVPTHMQDDIPLDEDPTSGQPMESLILWDLDEYQGMGKLAYTNRGGSRFRGLITPMELAINDDNFPFLLKSYPALIDAYEATSTMIRGIRTK
jgi:hypothetical protein